MIGIGRGPCETVSRTEVCGARRAPVLAEALTTSPAGTVSLQAPETVPVPRWARLSAAVAAAWLSPTTGGTG